MLTPGSCIVSGWGYEKVNAFIVPNQLKAANVTVLSDRKCRKLFGPKYPINSKMLCAGGGDTDACQVRHTHLNGFQDGS